MSPKKKVKRGVRVSATCPNGHPALSTGRCTHRNCPYSVNPPPNAR